ncbi:NACHT domain-containing protein [Gigaspora margarita]|uniref:NACHT domain-containing protein n=1 Tax=Gigaspora margarita TaxID=4874 RepID=A0A8H4A602_GIGMA|nr:NACHT domain-containing protein [Gigaspora margarita]
MPMTSNSYVYGMPAYIEPQCFENKKYKRDKKSDVYSFGVILWEISSGNRENPIEGTPPQYVKLYKQCWDGNPSIRPETKSISEILDKIKILVQDNESPFSNRQDNATTTPAQCYLPDKSNLVDSCEDIVPSLDNNQIGSKRISLTLETLETSECDIAGKTARSEKDIEHLKRVQLIDLERSRGEMLAQIGELKNQYSKDLNETHKVKELDKLKDRYLEDLNETHEFKEALDLYVKPRGTWSVPIIKTIGDKKEMDCEVREGDIEEVVNGFLTSRDKLTSHDKEILKKVANEFLILKEKTSLIKTVNDFFVPENQVTLEDINVLKVAANQLLVLRDNKALKLLEIAMNEFLESPKDEIVLKNAICNFLKSPLILDNKLSLGNKLALGHQITTEDVKVLKEASKDKKIFEETANKLLTLKAKEVLEIAINNLLKLKRKRVLLILGSGGTGKSTFNRYLARRLWEKYDQQDMMQSIPLFIALAPLAELINQNKDFIEAYLQKEGKLSLEQINDLRKRKFVFILDGYDEIAERDRHCYKSNMFSEWKNAKIIISCRPEYLGEGYEKRFWPKENEERGFQELTITPFSEVEIKQYIINYVNYSQKKGNPLIWDANTYVQQIKNMPQIENLVCNPILLKIALTVLPDLLGEKGTPTSQINRIIMYDKFIKKWFERAQERLRIVQLRPKEREEFNHLDEEDFSKLCLQFSKKFATKMFMDNNKVVINYDPDYDPVSEEVTSDWTAYLGNTNVKNRLMRFSMPLIRRGNQYWFFHKSLRDYLIACALLDSFKDKPHETPFNKQSIIPEPAIQQFLVERIEQMPKYKQSMLNFIECSKKDAKVQIDSANAITVLTRARIPLPINLTNIRVSGADLSNGIFNNSQFVKADLNNVNFQNAKLRSANLEGASLKNANFKGADLTDANLRHSNLHGTDFQDSFPKM